MAFVTFFPSGSGGGGGGNNDRFAPKYLVGNVPNGDTASAAGLAAGFTYFADTGNGAGIAAALAAAALVPGDVWIRPGSYNLGLAGAPAAGFIVPSGVRVSGSGQGTVIVPPLNGFQTVFTLSDTAELNDLRIPLIGVLAGTNPNPGVIQRKAGSILRAGYAASTCSSIASLARRVRRGVRSTSRPASSAWKAVGSF